MTLPWLTRFLPGGSPEPCMVPHVAPDLITAHERMEQAKANLRTLLVRLSADGQDEYVDMALDVLRVLKGRTNG